MMRVGAGPITPSAVDTGNERLVTRFKEQITQITRFSAHSGAGFRVAFLWVPAYPRERYDDVEGFDWVRGHVREGDAVFDAAMAARALRS